MPSSACALRSDRKSTRLNSSHTIISYAGFCLKKKKYRPAGDQGSGGVRRVRPGTRGGGGGVGLFRPVRGGGRSSLKDTYPLACFFFNDPATTEIYTLSLHDALPINDTATTEIYTLSLHDALPISVVAVSFIAVKRHRGKAVGRVVEREGAHPAGIARPLDAPPRAHHHGEPVREVLVKRADPLHRVEARVGARGEPRRDG